MAENQRSLFYWSFRALFVAMFSVVGIILGLVLILAILGGMGAGPTGVTLAPEFTPTLMADASGHRKEGCVNCPVILQLDIEGVIGGEKLNKTTIRKQLLESREGTFKGDRVKALLVYINTPGGTIDDADGIYQAIKEYKQRYKVPVYAFVDGMCASGGMYVACATDKIFASDVSIVGHVGVILPPFMNFSGAMDKLGIAAKTIYAGKGKDAMNPTRPWEEGEERPFQYLTNFYYDYFLSVVSGSRPALTKEKLQEIGAEIYPAPQAKEMGFVDVSGAGMTDVLKELVAASGIGEKDYEVLRLESKNWFAELFEGKLPNLHMKVDHRLQAGQDSNPDLQGRFLSIF